ncbi:MAG: hypothetical protein DMG89_13990 [Acidobacteria bacterium]|nr:MAG: hypothetical protein DMG89_13990 [Acidobacteriota bacterium]
MRTSQVEELREKRAVARSRLRRFSWTGSARPNREPS